MAWAWWLVAPLVVPALVAIVMWWRGRPRRPATTPESIDGHRQYLQALGAAAAARPDPPAAARPSPSATSTNPPAAAARPDPPAAEVAHQPGG